MLLFCLPFVGCGDGTYPSKTLSFSDIRDGKDITFIALELKPSAAVPWTKPVDIAFDEEFPKFDGQEIWANPTLISLGDGGVFSFPIQDGIDRKKFRDSITIDGGKHLVRGDVFQSSEYYPPGFKFSSDAASANAMQLVQQATSRGERMKRFRKVNQAIHSYHREFGHLPPAVVYGPDGTPWHSWRVLILPFMGLEYTYKQYDFSVPWNDAKNQDVLKNIPEPYVFGEFPSPSSTNTCIVLITGKDTAFPLEAE